MEVLKNLTTEELEKVYTEIYAELCNRKEDERKNTYKDLINAMKKFQKTDYFGIDDCYFEVYCEECETETEIELFEYFDSIIDTLERGM